MEAKEKTKYKSNAINKGIKVVLNCIRPNKIHMCFPAVIQAANQKISSDQLHKNQNNPLACSNSYLSYESEKKRDRLPSDMSQSKAKGKHKDKERQSGLNDTKNKDNRNRSRK